MRQVHYIGEHRYHLLWYITFAVLKLIANLGFKWYRHFNEDIIQP